MILCAACLYVITYLPREVVRGFGGRQGSSVIESMGRLQRRTVTCYLPRSDPQCHGAKIEKEADQGRGDAESPVRVTLGN